MHKIIEVIPNPYIALDKDGIPQGVSGAGMPGLFIGAQVDLVAVRQTGKQRFFYPLDRTGSPKKRVHMTADVVTAIHAGELIVCEAADAKACGFTAKAFLPPEEALAAEKAKALAYWQALKGDEHGPNKSATIGEIPREATVLPQDEIAPPNPTTIQLTPSVKLKKNVEV
jgi:hypothetical protein